MRRKSPNDQFDPTRGLEYLLRHTSLAYFPLVVHTCTAPLVDDAELGDRLSDQLIKSYTTYL